LNRPTPALQLLAKLSKFQGQKTDDINQKAFQTQQQPQNIQIPSNQPTVNEIQNSLPPVGKQQNLSSGLGSDPLDPNRKNPGTITERPSTSHRSSYDAHMNSSMGKILISDPSKAPPEVNIPGKKLLDPTISNYNNAIIGGQAANGDPYLTTAQVMNAGNSSDGKHHSRKKLLRPFEPELFVSPITGEPIANYGTWAEDLKASQSGAKIIPTEPEEDDDEKNDPIMFKLKNQMKLRGAKGIIGLSRVFKIMDDDGSKTLSFQEFKKAMKEMGMILSDSELIILFKRFDLSKSGVISYNDFLTTVSGRLNARRRRFVEMAFNLLDKDGSGELEVSDIIASYNASAHPDVISGKRTETQILTEFLETFEVGGERDGKVTRQEFEAYYRGISASIDSDDYFELMMRNAWHITGGEGQSANSANKRVLVTHSDGSQSVVEIQNDLGLKPNDKAEMMRRLKAQGVDVIAVSTGSADGGDDNKIQFSNNNKKPATRGGRARTAGVGNRSPNRTLLNKPGADISSVQRSAEPSAGLKMILQRIKEEMKKRGSSGFAGMQRRFKIMDDDGSGSLNLAEFKKAMREMKIELSESDLRMMFDFFDSDQSGTIDFNEFIQGVREPMSEKRLKFVNMAFTILDKDGSGEVDAQEISSAYDASKHPEVLAKRKTANQVLREFLDTFDVGGTKDGIVTRQEFQNYYHNISASIDNDDYFELMMRNAWHIAGGEGQSANSTNMTVLVTNSYGQNRTVMLQNDLGVKKDDFPTIYSRLRSQGIDDIAAINGKAIKVMNINGVDVVSTSGENVDSTKIDNRIEPPKVLRAPPFQQNRPKSAAPTSSVNRVRPVAGADPASFGGPSSTSLKVSAPNLSKNVIASLQQKQVQQAKATEELIAGKTLLDVLRTHLVSRGTGGIIEMQRSFQQIDTDNSKTIDISEFRLAVQQLNIPYSMEQIQTLFNFIDADHSGGIDFQEFLDSLRGPMNPNVLVLVHQIFDCLDVNRTGFISPQDVMANYDPTRHPDVATGMRSAEQVMQEFLNTFDVGASQPGKVSRDEFVTYYHNIAPSINDDDYLLTILRRTWRMREDIEVPPDVLLTQNMGVSVKNKISSAQNFAQGHYLEQNSASYGQNSRRPSTSNAANRRRRGDGMEGMMPAAPPSLYSRNQGAVPMMVPPRGDQSFNRPTTNQGGRLRPSASTPASSQGNQGEMLQQRIQEMEKTAILSYNQGKYAESEQAFKAMLNMLRVLYPENHPECIKVEKSILMVQRKSQIPR
jgi:Ca2+-binding EF-hand superfamily protein